MKGTHTTTHAAAWLLTAAMLTAQELETPKVIAEGPLARLLAEHPAERIAALHELGNGEASLTVLEAVAQAVGDRELEVRSAAVETLLKLRSDLRELREKLGEIVSVRKVDRDEWQVAIGIGGAFARLNVVPDVKGLDDADAQVRLDAVIAVCGHGDAAAHFEDRILALLADPDAGVRTAVAAKVGLIGWNETIQAAVIGAMKDAAASVRQAAATTLGGHGNDAAIVGALRGAVQDPDVDVRTEAIRSLGGIPSVGEAATTDIALSLRDRKTKVRVAALEAIRSQPLRDERTVREVVRCLEDKVDHVRLAAIQTVGSMGQAAAAAMPKLLELTHDSKPVFRQHALAAAWAATPDPQRGAVVLRAIETLLDEDGTVRGAAEESLQQFVDRPRDGPR